MEYVGFVWVKEKNVTKLNGQPLPNGRVGLTADKGEVRQSFSPEMQAYLRERDAWLDYLEGFRHSLGPRIPLYIPPYTVAPAQVDLYQNLEARMNAALFFFERRDLAEHARLKAQQKELRRFRPCMKHSFTDPTPPVVLHPQVLADFATVEEMCQKVLGELDR
jgi:hypothetical protein